MLKHLQNDSPWFVVKWEHSLEPNKKLQAAAISSLIIPYIHYQNYNFKSD